MYFIVLTKKYPPFFTSGRYAYKTVEINTELMNSGTIDDVSTSPANMVVI